MTTDETWRDAILDAALPRVAFEGWSPAMLRAAAKTAGADRIALDRAFPRGISDALEYFWQRADRAMLDGLATMDLGSMRIRDRIAVAVKLRFNAWSDCREAVRHALGLQALPRYGGPALRALYHTVDEIWHQAGDQSTDFNFYTKRLLLAGVITSTLLYWLDDRSEGSEESWRFLERRLADVMTIQKTRANLEKRLAGIGTKMKRASPFTPPFGVGKGV